jgi:hypothetical protein
MVLKPIVFWHAFEHGSEVTSCLVSRFKFSHVDFFEFWVLKKFKKIGGKL